MQLFSKMVSSYRMFHHKGNIFEEFSRKVDGYSPRLQANYLAEATDSVSENREVAAEVYDSSAAVDEVLQYVTCLYLAHVNSALTNIALYTEHINWDK